MAARSSNSRKSVHRFRKWSILILLAGAVAAAMGQVASTYAQQHEDLALSRANVSAAASQLQQSIDTARAGGVTEQQLQPVILQQQALLAFETKPSGSPDFGAAEARSLSNRATALRGLRQEVAQILGTATADGRAKGSGILDELDKAVAQARLAGLSVDADALVASSAHQALLAATTPRQAEDAVNGLAARAATLNQAVVRKAAADRAVAAAKAAASKAAAEAAAHRASERATPAATPGIGPGKVIVISLARQQLTAYQDGAVFLTTPVTTGRPELPTVTGSFSIQSKHSPYTMISPWPKNSPYWYPTSVVGYAMFFFEGYAIHDAPWRSAYGPGTEAHGSHGCVNTPLKAMEKLYAWAGIGTTVIVR
jgi:lipoprotein-anchoring transpeptidase ErfK/SrfK